MNEKLYDELVKECDRLTAIIDTEEVNSDKWKAAYGKKLEILEKMNAFNKVESEYYTKQEERKAQKERDESTLQMDEKKLEIEEKKLEQHERIEESRRAAEIALEQEKQKISWKRVGFEMSKILIPLAITIMARKTERHEMFDFEQHGKLISTVGRQFKLQDFFWKK